ncbi:SAM-dependent chlorinase/fluorinase [Actinospica durhamensis]|uniref:SAM-dependent chlorinase/fluorinase n=1 Tax=Actinospica durhamensis TaxID=1508375 RepID=A0A941ITF9_9ACTN|nr:SAM hydroxide adenosyltransferase [Actinospica durhamensis]MBR7837582.1 SAM-dependent chlorinase/fluorinase [Actinospica durhamensis]
MSASARLAALFGSTPTVLPLAGPDPEATAALTLLDVLRAGELLGGAGEPTVILVNIAPRDGHWPNGVPFCYFRHREHLVISTLNPRVLEPVRRHLGVTAVEVTDVREALEAAAAQWAEFDAAEIDEIARTQFRSLWYVPLLARWLVDGRPVPARREELAAPPAGARPVRVAVVDNFGNCKLDAPAAELPGYAAHAELELTDPAGAVHRVRCYDRLPDVPRGEPGVITGSSGVGFAELVVRGGSAAARFGLREGDAVCTLEPGAVGDTTAHGTTDTAPSGAEAGDRVLVG